MRISEGPLTDREPEMRQQTLATSGFIPQDHPQNGILSRMGKLVPWAEFFNVIEPHYPKAGGGPVGLERMLRMYFV